MVSNWFLFHSLYLFQDLVLLLLDYCSICFWIVHSRLGSRRSEKWMQFIVSHFCEASISQMQLLGSVPQKESLLISMQIWHPLSYHENLQDLRISLVEVSIKSECSDEIIWLAVKTPELLGCKFIKFLKYHKLSLIQGSSSL